MHNRSSRAKYAAVFLLLAVTFLGWSLLRTSTPAPAPGPPYLRGAHWFGDAWAVNFWNSNLERSVESDFKKIRDDGFNTVVLVVPWPGFAPLVHESGLKQERVDRLKKLIRTAAKAQLKVVLRPGYAWDGAVDDSATRLTQVWIDERAYQAWLGYFKSIWEAVGSEPNLEFAFFSWEDLWAVTGFGDATEEQRHALAQSSGFRAWLEDHHDLAAVSRLYGVSFSTWQDVPIPSRAQPSFKLFYEFIDDAWVNRFFVPARARFPKLSMEVRIDSDPIWDGKGQLLSWHSHAPAWELPGAQWTTVYWSPAMGGANNGETLTPEIAAARLRFKLEELRRVTGRRPIFIDQFLVEDFTPGFGKNGRLERDKVSEFLALAEPVLRELSHGYALWTWRDYHHDAVATPDFAAGWGDWSHSGARIDSTTATAVLAKGQSLQRHISIHEFHVVNGPTSAEICVTAQALGNQSALLQLSDGLSNVAIGQLSFKQQRSTRSFETQCTRYTPAADNLIKLLADGDLAIQQVRASGFIQTSGIYDTQGKPKPILTYWRALNAKLVSPTPLDFPLFEDGWMGRSHTLRLPAPKSPASSITLAITSIAPKSNPAPRLKVVANGVELGLIECGKERVQTLQLPSTIDLNQPLDVAIDADQTHQASGDERPLSCLILGVELAQGNTRSAGN